MATGMRRCGGHGASSWSFVVILTTALLSGCAGGNADNKLAAKVTGKVTYNGKPIPGGSLVFSPIGGAKNNKPGKAGQATIKPDGTYAVTTYTDGDGAVVGQHRLLFSPPPVEQPQTPAGGHAAASPPSPYADLGPKQAEITVAKGENKIDIELVKQAAPAAAQAAPSAAHGN